MLPKPLIPKPLRGKFALKLILTSFILLTCACPTHSQELFPPLDVEEINPSPPEQNVLPLEEAPYTLGAGDRIALNIFNIPEYSREYQVLIDGSLSLPLIGKVVVKGLTLTQTAELITQIYTQRQLLTSPIISLDLVGPRPINVAVVGEIRNPGSYLVEFRGGGGSGVEFPSVIDALELANGITAAADSRRIQIIRKNNDQEQVFTVNLWTFLQEGDLRQDIILRDGDTIVVPSADEINLREIRERANADFSANLSIPITVSIVGEVNRPGPYTLTGTGTRSQNLDDQLSFQGGVSVQEKDTLAGLPTATRAIQTAGGLTAKADVRNIQVRRVLPSGQEQVVTVNLWELLKTGDLNQDALLQEGDTIFVPAATEIEVQEARQLAIASFSPNRIKVNVVGEVRSPGSKDLQPNVTLQQAILAAGGFNNRRAKEADAELIRLNPNGTVTRREITVNFAAGLSEENNPTLLNNDIVFVKRSIFAIGSDFVFAFIDPFRQIFNFINLIEATFEVDFFGDGNGRGNINSQGAVIIDDLQRQQELQQQVIQQTR